MNKNTLEEKLKSLRDCESLLDHADKLKTNSQNIEALKHLVEESKTSLGVELSNSLKDYSIKFEEIIQKDPVRAYEIINPVIRLIEEFNPVLALKCFMPEGINANAKVNILQDENLFKEIVKYGKSFLKNPEKIIRDIKYSNRVVNGSSTKFAILTDMFLKKMNNPQRIIASKQLNENFELIHNKYYVDEGLNLTGVLINKQEAEYLYNQLKEKEITGELNEQGYLRVPIKMDLRGLELTEHGLIKFTDECSWTEAPGLIRNDYKFKIRNDFGVPIQYEQGDKTAYNPTQAGLFGCDSGRGLDSSARSEDLCNSGPDGRVILANSRSE